MSMLNSNNYFNFQTPISQVQNAFGGGNQQSLNLNYNIPINTGFPVQPPMMPAPPPMVYAPPPPQYSPPTPVAFPPPPAMPVMQPPMIQPVPQPMMQPIMMPMPCPMPQPKQDSPLIQIILNTVLQLNNQIKGLGRKKLPKPAPKPKKKKKSSKSLLSILAILMQFKFQNGGAQKPKPA